MGKGERLGGRDERDASLLETVLDAPSFTFRDAAVEAVTARPAVGSFLQRANRKVGCEERSAL